MFMSKQDFGAEQRFVQLADAGLQHPKMERPSPLKLAVAKVIGLESILLAGQEARLSNAINSIATSYNPTAYNFVEADVEANTSHSPDKTQIHFEQTENGVYLASYGLPGVTVSKRLAEDSAIPTTEVELYYQDPKKQLPSSFLTFQQPGRDGLFALNRSTLHRGELVTGIAALPFHQREPLVLAVAGVSAALCSPEMQATIHVWPQSYSPEVGNL